MFCIYSRILSLTQQGFRCHTTCHDNGSQIRLVSQYVTISLTHNSLTIYFIYFVLYKFFFAIIIFVSTTVNNAILRFACGMFINNQKIAWWRSDAKHGKWCQLGNILAILILEYRGLGYFFLMSNSVHNKIAKSGKENLGFTLKALDSPTRDPRTEDQGPKNPEQSVQG